MSIESRYYQIIGIKKEYPELGWFGMGVLKLLTPLYVATHGVRAEGQLPQSGAAIVASNHRSAADIFLASKISFEAGRFIQCIQRESLLNLNIIEDPAVLRRTGKGEDDLAKMPYILRCLRAKILRDTGGIPVRRGSVSIETIKAGLRSLDEGNLLGIFLQETRVKEGDLRDLRDGAGFFAVQRPDIPIVPMGVSGPPNGSGLIRIGQPITLKEARMRDDYPKIEGIGRLPAATIFIADRVAELLPENIQQRWFNLDRPNLIISKLESGQRRKL